MFNSTSLKDGGPAFPSPTGNVAQHGQLSVRDYFAGQYLAGMAGRGMLNPQQAATAAYEFADAMLAAREAR